MDKLIFELKQELAVGKIERVDAFLDLVLANGDVLKMLKEDMGEVEIAERKKVSISISKLYGSFGSELKYTKIEKVTDCGEEYLDLYADGLLVCMDGEECEIIEEDCDSSVLLNSNGKKSMLFILSRKEMDLASYKRGV